MGPTVSTGKMFRWYTDEEIETIKVKAIEAAVRAVLALDPHLYDEDTVRAAAKCVRDTLKETP